MDSCLFILQGGCLLLLLCLLDAQDVITLLLLFLLILLLITVPAIFPVRMWGFFVFVFLFAQYLFFLI